MAGNDRKDLVVTQGRRFWKMTGSGNDFVFIDGRTESTSEFASEFTSAATIQRICARGTGVGADGLVILMVPKDEHADIAIEYFNADGSLAALCGNATLCTASLAARLGAIDPDGFSVETGSGVLNARIREGIPEFDLPAIRDPQAAVQAIPRGPDEGRLGFVVAGIPHIVILVPDVSRCDVDGRGRAIRHDASLAVWGGANVNFVDHNGSGEGGARRWRIRTYERGVEAETLACGTGSVATGILLSLWGEAAADVELETASGRVLGIRSSIAEDGSWSASLRGEGRLVFEGETRDL